MIKKNALIGNCGNTHVTIGVFAGDYLKSHGEVSNLDFDLHIYTNYLAAHSICSQQFA